MKLRTFLVLGAVGLASASLVLETADAAPFNPASPLAQKKKKAKKAKAGKIAKTIQLAPRGLKWGLSNHQIANIYDKHFDAAYGEMLARAPLGPQTQALNSELEDRKDLIRRSVIGFGEQQTGVDATPLKGEYSYRNRESMSKVTLVGGTTRYFFFFGDSLWKVYDEHKLKGGGPLGATFSAAVEVLTEKFESPPKTLEADYDRGRNFEEAQWTDGTTLIRVVNREHEQIVAVVYVDESVQKKLPTMRKNRPRKEGIDRAVDEATSPASPNADKKK